MQWHSPKYSDVFVHVTMIYRYTLCIKRMHPYMDDEAQREDPGVYNIE